MTDATSADRPGTLLVVASASRTLQVLTTLLAGEGYRVLSAGGAAEAERLLGAEPIDLAIVDDQVQENGGYALAKDTGAGRNGPGIPVIYLVDGSDPVNAFRVGGVDFVYKPIRPIVLCERVKTHVTLALARERLARQVEEYETLLHVLGHDLMNPIAAIRGFLTLFDRSRFDDQQVQICEMVENCLKHQEDIVLNVRQLRALDSGKAEVPLDPVPLISSLATALTLFAPRLAGKRLTIEKQLPQKGGSIYVLGEGVALVHHVISNVISNAIKFSYPGGTIRISVALAGEWVGLTIADEGIGMPKSLLADVFRVDKPTSRPGTDGERGTGFGMPLVKKYVERFGGRVEIESVDAEAHAETHGTAVTLWLCRAALS